MFDDNEPVDAPWAACVASLNRTCRPPDGKDKPLSKSAVIYARVLWTLCECLNARQILEIGIGPDISTSGVTFLHWLKSAGGGHLHSIDINDELPRPEFRAVADELGVPWTITHGDSLTVDLPDMQPDLLYIDGDHDQPHATGDVERYWPLLRPGGYLVFDDYPGCDPFAFPMVRASMTVAGLQYLHLSHWPPHGTGRMVLQKAVA